MPGIVVTRPGLDQCYDKMASRQRRTTATVVALVESASAGPGVRSRAAVFRFSTEDGRTVEATSGGSSYPGPKIGAQVPIVYDPERPEQSAERTGVVTIQLVLAPVVAVIGVALIVFGVTLF